MLNDLNIKSLEAIVLGFGCTNSSLLSTPEWNDIQPMLPPIVSNTFVLHALLFTLNFYVGVLCFT